MVLLDLLGRRWALRVLWELRDARATFRALQERCDDVSPTVLTKRLKELREAGLVEHLDGEGYGLTEQGRSLGTQLVTLSVWAEDWAKATDA